MSAGPAAPTPAPAPPKPPLYSHLAKPTAVFLYGLPVLLIAFAYGTGAFVHSKLSAPPPAPEAVVVLDGPALYAQHCASCHGVRGDGNGVAHLEPRARAFGKEKFKLASTANGIPTDADLRRIIKHGIPGSAMPGFPEPILTDAQRDAVAAHVRALTWRGTYDRLFADAVKKYDEGGDEPEPHALAKKTDVAVAPGALLAAPAHPGDGNADSVSRGKAIFAKSCANCHGPEGRGDGPQVKDMKNEDGTPNKPRDLTAGVYKFGGDPASLYVRLRLGIPGTPMPATPASTVSDAELFDLINFVRSLPKKPDETVAAAPAPGDTAKK